MPNQLHGRAPSAPPGWPGLALALLALSAPAQEVLPGFVESRFFAEQIRVTAPADGVRLALNAPAPAAFRVRRPTRIVVYATPNGSTVEQTLGCRSAPERHWRFGIQHIGAQVRTLRACDQRENLVLACIQANGLSWPTWRAGRERANETIRSIVERITEEIPGAEKRVTLAAHSGGGSFIWAFLDGGPSIPDSVDRIVFLDANYSYDDARDHGDKLLTWLRRSSTHHLAVVAYDDREVLFEGKKVNGPTGGTHRACDRMLARFRRDLKITASRKNDVEQLRALNRRFTILRHLNPDNRILHSSLVGDMNGLIWALTLGTRVQDAWGSFGAPPVFTDWIQPEPGTGIEATRAADAPSDILKQADDARGGR